MTRALRALDKAGVKARIEIELDGRIVIITGLDALHTAKRNPWDDVLSK